MRRKQLLICVNICLFSALLDADCNNASYATASSNCNVSLTSKYCDNATIPVMCAGLPSSQYIACRAVNILQSAYYDTILFKWSHDGNWWNKANTIETLINFCDLSNLCDQHLFDVIYDVTSVQILLKSPWTGYDDIQWWSLAMIRLYEWKKDAHWLQKAIDFYDEVWQNAWDNVTCNGGFWWNVDKTVKNAITNELGMVNSIKLYNLTQDEKYLQQFKWTWEWFANTGMLNAQWLINDGMTLDDKNGSQQCTANNGVTWTYNQGVILGALSKMYAMNGDETLVDTAWNIIQSVMRNLRASKNGIQDILHEAVSDASVFENNDHPQFKGIFMRYLMYFYQNVISRDTQGKYADMKEEIVSYVQQQLTAIDANAMNPDCYAEFSAVWNASWTKSNYAAIGQDIAIDAYNWAFVAY